MLRLAPLLFVLTITNLNAATSAPAHVTVAAKPAQTQAILSRAPQQSPTVVTTVSEKAQEPTTDWPIFWATVALVIVGIGQALLFVWQLRLLRRSTDAAFLSAGEGRRASQTARDALGHSRQSAETQLRAYVGVSEGTRDVMLQGDPGHAGPTEVILHLVNYGKIPAANVRCSYRVACLDRDPGDEFDFYSGLTEAKGSMTIFPTQDEVLSCHAPVFSGPELDEICKAKGGDKLLFVFGQVRYHTGFADDGATNFCYQIWWRHKREPRGTEKPGFYYFKRHNNAQ